MQRTKKLVKDLYLLRASEELYIVLTIGKLGAFAAGIAVGYYLL